jgi:hypothetical protein
MRCLDYARRFLQDEGVVTLEGEWEDTRDEKLQLDQLRGKQWAEVEDWVEQIDYVERWEQEQARVTVP